MEPDVLEHILDGRRDPTNISFALLKNITENFSVHREIGHGGFATVYKGVLPKGNVAVKRIRTSHSINETLFYREVDSLLNIKHKNVVRFLGFCASTDQTAIQIAGSKQHIYAEVRERLLCFEYISNGSLQKYITDELRGMEWNTRYGIIRGICEGLHHLHKEHIYHMDLKPDNILLDNDMVPKITDFGLSRLDEKSKTMSEDRLGSPGYCAPEYISEGNMSFKSDMYSLGKIIIELVTGERAILNNSNNVLRRWRHRWKKSGKETLLVYQQVAKCIGIGLLCQEHEPSKRPFIWDIINDIRQMEVVNEERSNAKKYTFGQISSYPGEDDMLGIEPLKLHFPFALNKQMSCELQLTNETDSYIAFNVQNMSPLSYSTQPQKGIMPPRSKCNVEITLQAQGKAPRDMQHANEFVVLSTKVNDGLAVEDISENMFIEEAVNVVDEVKLDVVFDTTEYDDCIMYCDMAVERGRELADFKMISRALTRKGTVFAKLAKCSKDYDVAIETFQKALTEHLNPDTLKRLNDAQRAKKEFEQQEYCDPKIADEEREKGNKFYRQHKYPEAMKHYTEALRRNPKDPKVYSNRAACYTKLGALPDGFKDAEKCIELDPTFSKGYTRKGAIQFFLKDYDKALETYHAGLKHDPSNQEMIDGVERCIEHISKACRGLTPEEKEKKYDDCIKYCDMAVERGRELADFKMISRALTMKGTIFAELAKCSKDYDIAIETFQKALTEHRNPDTLKRLNGAEQAKKEFEQQEYYDPKIADEEREKGNKFYMQHKYPEAVKHYTEALRRNPKDPKVYSNRAACYTKLGALPEGFKDTEKCIELDPTFSKGYTRKGAIQFFLKDYDKALETYHAGLKHDPSNKEMIDGVGRCIEQINKAYRDLTPEEKEKKKTIPHIIQIINDVAGQIYSLDANQTVPLIITGHKNGYVQIWNYDTQKVVSSTKVSKEYVTNVKFIARKGWFVAVSSDCVIHVYNYENEMQKITSFRAHDRPQIYCSLAVHPTQSYVLSGCDTQIKFWDWDHSWNCIQTFDEHLNAVLVLKFNPEDTNSFASASDDYTVKVWSLDSPKSKYTLPGHSDKVYCMDFFTRDGQQYLISSSNDKTAKIWDMQKKCVHTLEHESPVYSIVSHPNLPFLITGTHDGLVRMWSSTNFRLKTILKLGFGDWVSGFAFLMGSGRVAVAHKNGVSVIEFRDEEEQGGSEHTRKKKQKVVETQRS